MSEMVPLWTDFLHWPQHLQLDRDTVVHTESADLQSRSASSSSSVGDLHRVSNAATVAQAAAEIAGGSKASPLGSRGSGMAGALNRALGSAKKAVGAASWRRSHAGWVARPPHPVANHRQLLCRHTAASTWCEPGPPMVLAVRNSCSLSLLLHRCRPPAQAEARQVEPPQVQPQVQPPQVEMQQAAPATSIPATPSSQYSAARLEQLMLNEELAFRGEHSTPGAMLSWPSCC